ncbi:MAG: hypothetical protein WD356_02365 [Pseudomonadales bacterium]
MSKKYDPVGTWVYFGLLDLYFGSRNLDNDVFKYGTFFYIMAAEKHLKSVLIDYEKDTFIAIKNNEQKREKVEKIVKSYSHNFDQMIDRVSSIYKKEMDEIFIPGNYYGFKSDNLIKAMYEGYMETRYPSVLSTSRHFPVGSTKGMFHDPLGSSFFTDFIEAICRKCWVYLLAKDVITIKIIDDIKGRFSESYGFKLFESSYLAKLPCKL